MNNKNNFTLCKRTVSKLLAILALVCSVYSLILFTTSIMDNSKLGLTATAKTMQIIYIIFVSSAIAVFLAYYFFLRDKHSFDFVVSISLIVFSFAFIINIINGLISMSEQLSKLKGSASRYPIITGTFGDILLPVAFIAFFSIAAFLIIKKRIGSYIAFLIIPCAFFVISYICMPVFSQTIESQTNMAVGTFYDLFPLGEIFYLLSLVFFGFEYGDELKNISFKKEEATSSAPCELSACKIEDDTPKYAVQTVKFDDEITSKLSRESLAKLESACSALKEGIITEDEYNFIKETLLKNS